MRRGWLIRTLARGIGCCIFNLCCQGTYGGWRSKAVKTKGVITRNVLSVDGSGQELTCHSEVAASRPTTACWNSVPPTAPTLAMAPSLVLVAAPSPAPAPTRQISLAPDMPPSPQVPPLSTTLKASHQSRNDRLVPSPKHSRSTPPEYPPHPNPTYFPLPSQ
jgi:hypothetical protein